MREERLLSVGIDIGTSTTQCVFSALTLTNTASSFSVPRVSITRKEVIWRAPVRLTPLQALDAFQRAPRLTEAEARRWIESVRQERRRQRRTGNAAS